MTGNQEPTSPDGDDDNGFLNYGESLVPASVRSIVISINVIKQKVQRSKTQQTAGVKKTVFLQRSRMEEMN